MKSSSQSSFKLYLLAMMDSAANERYKTVRYRSVTSFITACGAAMIFFKIGI